MFYYEPHKELSYGLLNPPDLLFFLLQNQPHYLNYPASQDNAVASAHQVLMMGFVVENKLICEKATKELGWTPKFNLEEGLRETFKWFASRMEISNFVDGKN